MSVRAQIVSLEFDRKDIAMNKLAATTLESRFRVFDLRTRHPTQGYASLTERVGRCRASVKCRLRRKLSTGAQVYGVAGAPPASEPVGWAFVQWSSCADRYRALSSGTRSRRAAAMAA